MYNLFKVLPFFLTSLATANVLNFEDFSAPCGSHTPLPTPYHGFIVSTPSTAVNTSTGYTGIGTGVCHYSSGGGGPWGKATSPPFALYAYDPANSAAGSVNHISFTSAKTDFDTFSFDGFAFKGELPSAVWRRENTAANLTLVVSGEPGAVEVTKVFPLGRPRVGSAVVGGLAAEGLVGLQAVTVTGFWDYVDTDGVVRREVTGEMYLDDVVYNV